MPNPSTGPGRTPSSRGTRPLGPRPQRIPSEAKSSARLKLERMSAGPLLRMHALPRLVIPVLLFALFAAGLFVKSAWSGIFFTIVALFVAWLLALSWPLLTPSSRVLRVVVVTIVVFAAIWRFTGHA
ncbi:MAG: DUF6703 family protein [Actinomycetes bacterium]